MSTEQRAASGSVHRGAVVDPGADPPLTVGQVASLLGVPSVTLRSWETRYGVGPSQRTTGGHRRYGRHDVERLQRMRNLIVAGTTARDAARLSATVAGPGDHGPDPWAAVESHGLVGRASAFEVQALADQLDACLAGRGLQAAWEQVICPALRDLEARQIAAHDCTDIEMLLTQASFEAVDRYAGPRRPPPPQGARWVQPVLLVCCPGERHHLPLKVLYGVLVEQAIPAVLLGPGLPADAVTAAIERATPSVVVLWSMVRRPGMTAFRDEIAGRGVVSCAVGPGWPRTADPATKLADAVVRVGRAWFAAHA